MSVAAAVPTASAASAAGRGARATTLWLRVAAVIELLFTAGHTLGGLQRWSPTPDNEVLRQMIAFHFDVQGVRRSYYAFYMGFGWTLSVAMLLQAVLLWQLASLARSHPAAVRPMIALFALATLASGVVAWRLIFPIPVIFSAALLIVLVVAFFTAGRTARPALETVARGGGS